MQVEVGTPHSPLMSRAVTGPSSPSSATNASASLRNCVEKTKAHGALLNRAMEIENSLGN